MKDKKCPVCHKVYPVITKYWIMDKTDEYFHIKNMCRRCWYDKRNKKNNGDFKYRFNQRWCTKILDCRRYDIPFENIRDEIWKTIQEITFCECCGCLLNKEAGITERDWQIDRIIPAKGYISGNIGVICRKCNTKKRNLTIDDLEMFIMYIQRKQNPF